METERQEKPEYEMRICKYEFSDEEKSEIAETLAIKTQELEETEGEKKSAMSSFKDKIDGIAAEQRRAARLYKDGFEMRNLECLVERDFGNAVVRHIRTDNGSVAAQRAMTMGERQRRLDELLEAKKQQTDADVELLGRVDAALESPEDIVRQNEISRMMAGERSAL